MGAGAAVAFGVCCSRRNATSSAGRGTATSNPPTETLRARALPEDPPRGNAAQSLESLG